VDVIDKDMFKAIVERDKKNLKRQQKQEARMINPRLNGYQRGLLNPNKVYSARLFRRVSEKAWLSNACIGHIIDKTIPYTMPVAYGGTRGFAIELTDKDKKISPKQKKRAKEITEFFLQTGWDRSDRHPDDLNHYVKKILRDLQTLDQTATEKVPYIGGGLAYFLAIDAATIVRCTEEGYDGDDKIKFVQQIESQIVAQFTENQLMFQFDNPRTDIENFGYGYSKIEQCIDLFVSSINSFKFNADAFTEDNLPRGMLLLNGDMDMDAVEEIEDYIVDTMSQIGQNGGSKWKIPIIPTGQSGDKSSIQWQKMGETNNDMQYAEWMDFLTTGICAIYGVDPESLGLKTKQSAKIMESGSAEGRKYSDDKGIGNAIIFLSRHFQSMLDDIDPEFRFVFHGFEQDDAKELREAITSELSSTMSLNDMLREKDKPIMDAKLYPWAEVAGMQNSEYKELYINGATSDDETGQEDQQQEPAYDEFDEGFGKSIKDNVLTITI